MTLARDALAAAPLAGTWAANTTPPGTQPIPEPPVGGSTSFAYTTAGDLPPLAALGLAGAGVRPSYPGGGLVLVPDADAGVMRVTCWWPSAANLQLLRVVDGSVLPVRGAYPAMPGPTRRNLSTNPGVEVSAAGYTAIAGAPTIGRTTVTPSTGEYSLRITATAAGTSEVALPVESTRLGEITAAFDLRLSARPSAVTVYAAWLDGTGAAAGVSNVGLIPDQFVASVGQWTRQLVRLTPPSASAVTVSTMSLAVAGMAIGDTADLDRVTVEAGRTDGAAYTGNTLAGAWTGTPGLSASVLAATVTVADGECPLDVAVSYLLVNPRFAGGRIASPASLLPSLDRTWLTHPGTPGVPRAVSVRETPVLERGIDRGVFRPMGRRRPVVITGSQRWAPSGTIGFNALSAADRAWLDQVLDDGAPLLLRTPGSYHFADRWLSLGAVSEDPEKRLAYQDAWLVSAPFDEVDPPSALVS